MRYSPAQYAAALHELIAERPSERARLMRKLAAALERNGDQALGAEIAAEFAKLLDADAVRGGTPTVTLDPRGGSVVRKGDTLVDNSLSHRLARIREALR